MEWVNVSAFVASTTGDDELSGGGHVRLRNTGASRCWDATDGRRYSVYEAPPGGDEVTVMLPGRLVRAAARLVAVGDAPALRVAVDEDGVPMRVGLRSRMAEVGMPAGPLLFPEVERVVERSLDAPYIDVTVDRWLLRSAVCTAMELPAGVSADGPPPPCALDVAPMAMLFTVDWSEHGETVFLIDAEADGEAQVAVDISLIEQFVSSLKDQWTDDDVTISVPLDDHHPVILRSAGWSCYLLAAAPDVDQLHGQVDSLMGEVGLGSVVVAGQGTWSARIGEAEVTMKLVLGEPPRLAVSTVLLQGVTASPDLLAELNDINGRVPFVSAVLNAGVVELSVEVLAEGLGPDTVKAAARTVAQVAVDLGPVMSVAFGGSTAFRNDR